MIIEVTAWAPTREAAEQFMEAVGLIEIQPEVSITYPARYTWEAYDEDEGAVVTFSGPECPPGMTCTYEPEYTVVEPRHYRTLVDVQIDHIGPIDDTDGHHVNVRYYGDSAQALIEGLPQMDENGSQLDLFERTHILDMVDARTGIQFQWDITRQPIPPGYEYNGIRLFDPSLIGSRSRVWA